MRVLQIHNQYRVFGGEDVMLDLEAELLRQHGHEVERFTVSNKSVEKPTLRTGLETVWSPRSKRSVEEEISAVGPDIIHVHNTFPVLSPSIYWAAERVPVVQTLHNYRLTCVNASLLRNDKPCQDCVGKSVPWPGILHRCYRGSLAASGAVGAMQVAHRALGTFREKVDAYIALTDFAKSVMVRGGLPEDLVHVKPNFVSDPHDEGTKSSTEEARRRRGDRISFVGRLSHEKGVDLLLGAWEKVADMGSATKTELAISGDGPERESLHALARGSAGVRFRGWLSGDEVMEEIQRSRFVVLPSRWYEGFPMVVVESLSAGTPVIVPDHGGFPDIVTHGETGFLFRPGDRESLKKQLHKAASLNENEWRRMSEKARETYRARYTPEKNYEILIGIYAHAAERNAERNIKKNSPKTTNRGRFS